MKGQQVDIEVSGNSGLYVVFDVDTTQSMSSWTAQGYVYDSDAPTVSVLTLTTSIDASAETITVSASSLSALTAGTEYNYRILVNPNVGYGLRFFYGTITKSTGGPAWV